MSDFHSTTPAEVREAARKLNEEARDKFSADPQWRADRAADMTQSIYEDFQYENVLDALGQVEYLNVEDRSFVRETRGLKAFWIARGGYIEQSDVRTDIVEIPRDTVGFHVSEFEDKLTTGFAEASTTLVELGTQRLGAAVQQRARNLLVTAVNGTAYEIEDAGALDGLAALNHALRTVRDNSKSRQVTVLGRATATERLMDTLLGPNGNGQGFLPSTNEEMVRTGVLGTYRGAPIRTITNYLDGDGAAYWPEGELWVIANDAAKFAFFGGLRSKEYMEQDNWYWHYLAKQEFGGLVNHPERSFKILDTDLTATATPYVLP
jgi:hypothetical protein